MQSPSLHPSASPPAHASDEPAEPSRFAGRYRVIERLGAGGMGAVYKVEDEANGRTVAFKQLHSSAAGGNRRLVEALFEREYHTLARLSHPRIIEVFDYGITEQGPYYTMELLDGKDLQQLAPLPYRDACRLLRDVASSLALIHAHRLVHRDVSPRNVRLTRNGRAKLIDFGALTPFGPVHEVVGTPACMPPEVLHRMPLDQRADLFALGVVGYWALTASHPYPARRMQELELVWQHSPRPPSALVDGIPPALDSLIMSLLALDPLGRPSSAAAVIDQLTAVAALEAEEHELNVQSYLQSGPMVGRAAERDWASRRIARLLEGKGAEMMIDGGPGAGKTRLLHELALEAQLKGVVVLKVDAQVASGAYGVAHALALQLLAARPELARKAAQPSLELLRQIVPELVDQRAGEAPAAVGPHDANERRAVFQQALHAWFKTVVTEQALLLCVDNVQAADHDSAAFVAALGHEARALRLILLLTQRTGDQVTAKASIQMLRKRAGHLKLGGLSPEACEELARALFGDVANVGRMATLLFEQTGGSPQQCMDLAQLLIRKQTIKYVDGTWVLPFEVAPSELPERADGLITARLALLRPDPRAMLDALCVHEKPISLEQCLSLAPEAAQRDVFGVLDELVSEQFLVEESGAYRFAQEKVRAAVAHALPDAQRRAAHARAADVLLASAGDRVGPRAEAAFHLLHAGEQTRGADLLASAAQKYSRREGGEESVEQVVRALETAIAVYDRTRRSDYELARLIFPIMPLAFLNDRRVALRFGERAIMLGLKLTGLGLAGKLSRFVGKKLGLMLGLLLAGVRFKRQQKRGLDYGVREAIGLLCGCVPSSVGAHSICYDVATTQRLVNAIEPLRLFGPDQVPAIMADLAQTQLKMVQGYERAAHDILEGLERRFQKPELLQMLGEARWKTMTGGILFSIGILTPYEFGNETPKIAEKLETLGIRIWSMAAAQIRLLHHALRGELDQQEHWRGRVELFAMQGSSMWQVELFLPVLLLGAEVQVRDAVAARRIWQQLARRAETLPDLEKYAQAAHAAYLALRGDLKASLAAYERVLPLLPPRNSVSWSLVRAWYAEALNASGQHERAKALMIETMSHTGPGDERVAGRYLEPQRQLALAEAGLGDCARAVSMLDALLAKHGREDQPLLVGMLYKARAEVALRMLDAPAFEEHFAQMQSRFRGTRHPALVAQCERLAEEAITRGVRQRATAEVDPSALAADSVLSRGLSELSAAADPFSYALRLIAHETAAESVYIYVLEGTKLRLVSANTHQDVPLALEERLEHLVERSRFDASERARRAANPSLAPVIRSERPTLSVPAPPMPLLDDDDGETQFIASDAPEAADLSDQVGVLWVRGGAETHVYGGVIVRGKPNEIKPLDPNFLAAIASKLQLRFVSSAIG